MRELHGPGRDSAKIKIERTQVSHSAGGRLTVIPLDQIDHVEAGRSGGPLGFLALAIGALIAGGAVYVLGLIGTLSWVGLAGGGILAAAGFAGYFLQRPPMVRIDSGKADVVMFLAPKQAKEALAFVAALMQARTEYLEGVYNEDDVAGNGEE